MHANVYPCIIYQRLRPSAPEASELARRTVWPLAEELVEQEGYTLRGRYGDSEFAPPFCGGSEIRPGFEQALEQARRIAAEGGTCTLLIGDASAIGDGDPFLPAYVPPERNGHVHVRLVNFHLRPHARSTSLRSAWRYFDHYRDAETRARAAYEPLKLPGVGEMDVVVRRDPERLLATLYLANRTSAAIALKWTQLLRRQGPEPLEVTGGDWHDLVIPAGSAAYVESVFQGDLPWVRQLRFKYEPAARRIVGSVHLAPADLMHERLPLVWEGSV